MKYFRTTVLLLFAVLLGVSCARQPAEKAEVSVQLYNFRTLINTPEGYAANHEDIFQTLAQQGYASVEAANYRNGLFYGVAPEQFKADVEAAGLEVLSSHINGPSNDKVLSGDFTDALAWWDKTIEAHKAAGVKYIVWPFLRMPDTLDELKNICDYFNEIGRRCAAQGIQFGYHSHSHEFVEIDDEVVAYDYMIQNTDPDLVFFQMDVYWAVIGKASPVDYFHKYPGRFKMLHIKDEMDLGKSGMVGFDAIFRNFDVAGVQDIVVEEERFPTEDWKASMQTNIDYIKWLGKVLK